ncbi:hypothetical protein HJC23_012049 [Cyclotella cryptica]|uniref:Uncharacterized protein n=1 Tax=Cyclotella cryptica TaxID=29204 RepID=A0ABD3PQQ3_9STRA|eukprot:CCRYP_012362-RA/>CCRYP_012362-RA protein AED:0.03 eAED:0.03 QI:373/1/1/1/1/1/2/85/820
MSGGVGRFARKKPQESAASEKPPTPTGRETNSNNDASPPPAPEFPEAFASFDDRPATSGSHGFASIGMYAMDDDAAMNGFSGLEGSDTFRMLNGTEDGGGEMGGEFVAFSTEHGTIDLGEMGQGNDVSNPMAMPPKPSGTGLSMFKKKTPGGGTDAPNAIGAPQESAKTDAESPPKSLDGSKESGANVGNFDIDADGAARVEFGDKHDNVSSPAALSETEVCASNANQNGPSAAKVPESISGEGEDDVQDDLTATSYYSAKEKAVMDTAKEDEETKQELDLSSAGEGKDACELSDRKSDTTSKVSSPKNAVAPDAVVIAKSQRQQVSLRPMTVPRVSLSPLPNFMNRDGKTGTSPPCNAMADPSNVPFVNGDAGPNQSTTVTTFAHGSAASPPNHTTGISPLQNIGLANATNANSNQYTEHTFAYVCDAAQPNDIKDSTENHMDDDHSIIIPGFPDQVGAETANNSHAKATEPLAQFSTDSNSGFSSNDLDASMDMSFVLDDVTMKEAEANDSAFSEFANNSADSTGFIANFSCLQNMGSNATKPSFSGRCGGGLVDGRAPTKNTLKAKAHIDVQQGRPNSLAASSQKSKSSVNSGSSKDRHISLNKATSANLSVLAARNSMAVTPPNSGRGTRPLSSNPFARAHNNATQYNNAVTPDVNAESRARPATTVPAREVRMQPSLDGYTEKATDRMMCGHNSTHSPPASTNDSDSTTPKMSNVQVEPTANQTAPNIPKFGEISCSNLSFDELLNQFIEDIQETNDLHEQGDNELLELEVDLSHAMAAALRYKGDMMDLLDEIQGVQATAERMLAQFSEPYASF